MYPLIRPLLFRLPPETAHNVTLAGLRWLERAHLAGCLAEPVVAEPVEVMGLTFPNPVGLAAGLDKNGDCIDGLAALGFGFLEIGTVTPRPQPGNPQPRMFRLPEASAIINRMGFNNQGVDYLARQVERARYRGILGINIGKNADTPLERAAEDYLHGMRRVYTLASYITVNLSSPNTAGLRDLQFGEPLARLLGELKACQQQLQQQHGRYTPVVIKIAPDMADDDIASVAETLLANGMDGVIATNTTITRAGVEWLPHGQEKGGLSGAPLTEQSTHVVRVLKNCLGDRLPIIAAGGVMDAHSAADKIRAGARLVQLYSGFVYRGPSLIGEVAEAIHAVKLRG